MTVSRKELVQKLMRYYSFSRCGDANGNMGGFAHPACHITPARIYGTNDFIDVHGGWHDAGDYGRYIMPAAKTVMDLLLAYTFDRTLFSETDLIDEVRWELDWMLRMQRSDGAVYHKVTCASFCDFIPPEEELEELIVSPVSTEATADFCGACAFASLVYKETDPGYAAMLYERAFSAWSFLIKHERISFYNPEGISTGEYGADENTSDMDERYFAACALYCCCPSEELHAWICTHYQDTAINTALGWTEMGGYGSILLAFFSDADPLLSKECKKRIIESGTDITQRAEKDTYGIPFTEYAWGSNMYLMNDAAIAFLASREEQHSDCKHAAMKMIRYILGRNPLGMCYITGEDGFTGKSPIHPHHRPSMARGAVMPGMLVGGPNSYLHDDYAKEKLAEKTNNECYIDAAESYSTNEVAIYWNSALILALSLTETDYIE